MKRKYRCSILALGSLLFLSACQGNQLEEYRMTGIEQMQNGDYEAARQSFDQALAASKGKADEAALDVLKYRGEAEYMLADYQAAAATYDVLQQLDESNMDYCLFHCLALAKAGDLAAAAAQFQQAKTIVSESPDETKRAALMAAAQNLGAMLEEEEEFRDTAFLLYQEMLDEGYQSAILYNRIGLNRMADGDYDGAIQLFEQGLAAGDMQAAKELRYNQAVAYEYKAEFQQALELFQHYQSDYGADDDVLKEINFLKTR